MRLPNRQHRDANTLLRDFLSVIYLQPESVPPKGETLSDGVSGNSDMIECHRLSVVIRFPL